MENKIDINNYNPAAGYFWITAIMMCVCFPVGLCLAFYMDMLNNEYNKLTDEGKREYIRLRKV